jgi:hypothetical protein
MCFSGRVAPEKRLFREIVMTYENPQYPQYPQLSSKAMEMCGIGVTFCGFCRAGSGERAGFGLRVFKNEPIGYVPDM